jgi:hypothetical protein
MRFSFNLYFYILAIFIILSYFQLTVWLYYTTFRECETINYNVNLSTEKLKRKVELNRSIAYVSKQCTIARSYVREVSGSDPERVLSQLCIKQYKIAIAIDAITDKCG